MRFLILIILFALASCKPQDLVQTKQEKENPYKSAKWKTFPITLIFPSSKRADIDQAVIASVSKWNEALRYEAIKIAYEDYDDTKYISEKSKNRVFFLKVFDGFDGYGDSKRYINPEANEIVKADIIIDDRGDYKTDFDLENVLSHQIGHILGQAHITESDSIMKSSVNRIYNTFMTSRDIQRIRDLYPVEW